MNQLSDFLVWMQIEEPNMPLDRNEREGYFYHDIVEKMFKAWKVSHMHWTPLAGRISPEKKRSFKEDDFPETLVDRLKGVSTSAMGAQKPSKMEMEAAREIERLRAERDELIHDNARLYESLNGEMRERLRLEAEAERLRKDAERYQHLRHRVKGEADRFTEQKTIHFLINPVGDVMKGSVAQHLDEAIDAAMSALPDTKGE